MRISVIIPVYNVAPYIMECLDSIKEQTFGDWECVCVDDGSTDGSSEILDSYAKNDSRFVVIHQKNSGVSDARNRGIEEVTGEWMTFVDGDDWMTRNALEEVNNVIENNDCGAILVYGNGLVEDEDRSPTDHIEVLGKYNRPLELLTGRHATLASPFGKFYKTSLFRDVRYISKVAISEDACYFVDALCVNTRWLVVSKKLYYYRQRNNSATNTIALDKYRDMVSYTGYMIEAMRYRMGASTDDIRLFWGNYGGKACIGALAWPISRWRAFSPHQRREIATVYAKTKKAAGFDLYGYPLNMFAYLSGMPGNAFLVPFFGFINRGIMLIYRHLVNIDKRQVA